MLTIFAVIYCIIKARAPTRGDFHPKGDHFVNTPAPTLHFGESAALPDTDVIVQRVPISEEIRMHSHEFIEIAFVERGSGWHPALPGTARFCRMKNV